MSAEIIIAILGTGGLTAVAGAVINGLVARRKLGAEATQVITEAAKGVVERMEAELERAIRVRDEVRDRAARLEARVNELETEQARYQDEWMQVLQLHAAWDMVALQHLNDSDLPPPPPLYPPRSRVN